MATAQAESGPFITPGQSSCVLKCDNNGSKTLSEFIGHSICGAHIRMVLGGVHCDRIRTMPDYEICLRDAEGHLALQYDIPCADDTHAKVIAHALMSRKYKHLEVWHGDELIYERPETPY